MAVRETLRHRKPVNNQTGHRHLNKQEEFKLSKEDVQKELNDLVRLVIDLKMEKKKYNAEINDQIKDNEKRIKELVGELSV